jgi:putative flippase GtrA
MAKVWAALDACPLPVKFTLASLLGFAADAAVLHVLIEAGGAPAVARVVSLFCAMQVTFLVNGLVVFRRLDRARPWRQWAAYMLAHGFGNFCNYWIFVTLVSLHQPPFSRPIVALAPASLLAWTLNYLAARYVVFRRAKAAARAVTVTEGVTPQGVTPHGVTSEGVTRLSARPHQGGRGRA